MTSTTLISPITFLSTEVASNPASLCSLSSKPMHAPIHGEVVPCKWWQEHAAQDDYGVVHRSNIRTRWCGEHENDGHEHHEHHCDETNG